MRRRTGCTTCKECRFEVEIGTNLADDLGTDDRRAGRKAAHERVVANDADRARDSARALVHQSNRRLGKDFPPVGSGDLEPRPDVRVRLRRLEQTERASQRDPLFHLDQTRQFLAGLGGKVHEVQS